MECPGCGSLDEFETVKDVVAIVEGTKLFDRMQASLISGMIQDGRSDLESIVKSFKFALVALVMHSKWGPLVPQARVQADRPEFREWLRRKLKEIGTADYDACRTAIELLERELICITEPGVVMLTSLSAMQKGISYLDAVLSGLKHATEKCATEPNCAAQMQELCAKARHELGTPQFRAYLAARLGVAG